MRSARIDIDNVCGRQLRFEGRLSVHDNSCEIRQACVCACRYVGFDLVSMHVTIQTDEMGKDGGVIASTGADMNDDITRLWLEVAPVV